MLGSPYLKSTFLFWSMMFGCLVSAIATYKDPATGETLGYWTDTRITNVRPPPLSPSLESESDPVQRLKGVHGLHLRRPSSPSSGPRSNSRPAQPAPRTCGQAGAVNGASSHLARVSRLRDRVLSADAHLLLHHDRRDHRRRQDDGKVLKGDGRDGDHREAPQTHPRRAAQRLRTASIHSASSVNRQQGGVLADGVNSIIACLCGASYRPTLISRNLPQSPAISRNLASDLTSKAPAASSVSSHAFSSRPLTGSPPNTTFSQNNGIIALTKCGLQPPLQCPRCAPAS